MKSREESRPKLEIFPGNLLDKRPVWQSFKAQLPAHTCLLITSLVDPQQSRRMFALGRSLQQKGVSVLVLSVG